MCSSDLNQKMCKNLTVEVKEAGLEITGTYYYSAAANITSGGKTLIIPIYRKKDLKNPRIETQFLYHDQSNIYVGVSI